MRDDLLPESEMPVDTETFDRQRWLDAHERAATMASWDERAPAHAASPDYAIEAMIADPALISDVVAFDVPRLGDIKGLRGIHLQCHIGTDTVSLSRLGARMTGLDYSAVSVAQARSWVQRAGDPVDFVQSDVYDALTVLPRGQFDLVFTGIGALCWLPRIDLWANLVAELLAPGGRLFVRDGHPMLWAIDDPGPDGALRVEHAYFERAEPTVWTEGGTYVATDAQFQHNTTYEWNHGLGEIVGALLRAGLTITMLDEHDSVPWDPLPGLTVGPVAGEYRLAERRWRLPLSYTLGAMKPLNGRRAS